MDTIILIWVGLFGVVVGSFLNVVIYRLPLNKGLVVGRSICPHCSRQLKWYHNVPLLCFASLLGTCAVCRQPISWRCRMVALVT